MKKIRIREHEGYYFSYDPGDPSIPVTINSNWRKTGQTPAVIDEFYSRPLKSADDRDRLYTTITTMDKKQIVYLDTLVASYLLPNPDNHERVIHKDNNIYNCHPSNLKWVSNDEYKLFAVSINRAKGRIKQFEVTYSDGRAEIITGFLEFLEKNQLSERALYQLRKGEIAEYKGIISFEEVDRVVKSKIPKKEAPKIDLSGYNTVELDDWPGYYVVYKKDDSSEPVRIFSKWKKDKDEMILCEHFVRETSQHIHKTGYVQVNMKLPGQKKIIKKLHRLIAQQLIQNPNDLETVDHIDSDKLNNHPSNLQWFSNEDNVRKAFLDGRYRKGSYEITYSNGEVKVVENMSNFCIENNYSSSRCYSVINGKQPTYKNITKIIKLS
jgi:hypothetical protein